MSDGELAQLLSDGRDSMNESARQALDAELSRRGLSQDVLAAEYDFPKPRRSLERKASAAERLSFFKKYQLAEMPHWKLGIVVLSLAVFSVSTFVRMRESRLNSLYNAAMDLDTAKSKTALEQLGAYRGKHADELILKIATQTNWVPDGRQQVAIALLSKRGDAATAQHLATTLLHPYQSLVIREAVARTLVALPCSGQCLGYVLDYEERIWRGEPTPESQIIRADDPSLAQELAAHRRKIDEELGKILIRERNETIGILVQTHGLGNVAVSPFALHMLARLKLNEACELLGAGKRLDNEKQFFPERAKAKEAIARTRNELGCPATQASP